MRVLAEYAAFLALSVGAHVLVLSQPGGVGGGPGGEAGEVPVTLAAMPGDMAEMVAAWTAPPEAQDSPATLAPPPLSDVARVPPAVADTALRQPRPTGLPVPDAPRTAPQVDSTVPPPPEEKVESVEDQEVAPPPSATRPVARVTPEAPRPAQKASGQGAAPQAGTERAKVAKQAGPGASQTRSLMAQWGGRIHASIERNKRFPRGTRASGRVGLRITLSHDGRLQAVSVTRSSGHAALDRAAVEAVRRTRFPAAPRGLAAGHHRFNLPVSFGG